MNRYQTWAMQNPSVLATQRDSKDDSIWVARREMQAPHDAMHRASMGATELQSCWLEMRKTLGKRGLCSMGFRCHSRTKNKSVSAGIVYNH